VELSDVKIIEGDTIAYIKYDLRYYVNGDFMTPFSENSTPTSLDCTYTGIAEFNITKGKWSNYNLLTTINGIGFPTTQTKQIQRLVELKKIPKEVLEYK